MKTDCPNCGEPVAFPPLTLSQLDAMREEIKARTAEDLAGLNPRTVAALMRADLTSLDAICARNEYELDHVPGIGTVGVKEIVAHLEIKGRSLAEPGWRPPNRGGAS